MLALRSQLQRVRFVVIAFFVVQCGLTSLCQAQLVDAIRSFFRDPLIHAIDKGLKPNGDLAWELNQLEQVPIESEAHAEAILRALASISPENPVSTQSWTSIEYEVTSLFSAAAYSDSDAYDLLWRRGIPELIKLYQRQRSRVDSAKANGEPVDTERIDDLILMLDVFAAYQTREGTECVIEAAKSGLGESSYYWESVFNNYIEGHPQVDRLFEQLSKRLPKGNIAGAMLSTANTICLEQEDFPHPFDTPAGMLRLKAWLTSASELDQSHAYSAAVALAFLKSPVRDALLEIAHRHRDFQIRVEAAWAAARAGLDIGTQRLAEYCLDVHASVIAQTYLEELERTDLIPAEAREPQFAAKAEMSHWLQDENELGDAPVEIEVLDQRKLTWFDSDEEVLFSVVRFRADGESPLDDPMTGVGVVGSMTWSFFDNILDQLPVEDIYAVHCTFEAAHQNYVVRLEGDELPDTTQFLSQWSDKTLAKVQFLGVYEVSKELAYPRASLAVAQAELDGKPGFAVFDGEQSRWYPSAQFPADTLATHILDIHLGRQLLGFVPAQERELRVIERVELSSEQIVEHYEKLIRDLANATADEKVWMLDGYEPLTRHFDKFVNAKAKISGEPIGAVFAKSYDLFLDLSRGVEKDDLQMSLDSFSLVGEKFEEYAKIVSEERPQRVAELIKIFEPYWKHNYGRSRLAAAAFAAGLRTKAKRLLEEQYASNADELEFASDSLILAELWAEEGKNEQAKKLLVGTLERLESELADISEVEYQEEIKANIASHAQLYEKLYGARDLGDGNSGKGN